MNPKIQNFISFLLIILFLIVAPSIIFYAMGYRLNKSAYQNKNEPIIKATGGIRIDTPIVYNIEIDGIEKNTKTPFLKTGLDTNPINIKLSKENFYSWEKILNIEPNIVTLINSVILFPENPDLNNISNLISPSEIIKSFTESILYSSSNPNSSGLWIYNIISKENIPLLNNLEIKGSIDQKYELIYSNISDQIIIKTSILEKDQYYLISLQNDESTTPINITDLFNYDVNLANIEIVDLSNNILTYLQGGHIFQYNLAINKKSNIILSNVTKAKLIQNNIYYLKENTNEIYIYNLNNDISTLLISGQESITQFFVSDNQSHIISIENNILWVKNLLDNSLESEKLDNLELTNIRFSYDNKRALLYGNNGIYILYLDKFEGYQNKKAGDLDIIYKSDRKLTDIDFFKGSEEYITFIEEDILYSIEIDVRGDKINKYNLGEAKSYYQFINKNDSIFILNSKDNLKSFQFPIRTSLF